MFREQNLLIVGASARAAAYSALRAGLAPVCADLFADRDLQAVCPVQQVASRNYPWGLEELIESDVLGPWMYTGALENRREFVSHLAKIRPLWGNAAQTLRCVRDPFWFANLLSQVDLPCPEVRVSDANAEPDKGWLVKPLHGAGGRGIGFSDEDTKGIGDGVFLQEFISGSPCAAVFVGMRDAAILLGVTEQLIGQPRLNAAPFHYCGSIGPLSLAPQGQAILERIGNALATTAGIKGLFGIDFIMRDGTPWPVEVNPRYTASVEVLEYALGIKALDWHRRAFVRDGESDDIAGPPRHGTFVGKAILFAKKDVTAPADGPWRLEKGQPFCPDRMPAFADIPQANQLINKGRPILTFFAEGDSRARCLEILKETAADLDRRLFGG
ncbi:MAG: ATP-grasp domain-containing protein [Gemmataceae bacterium]